MEEWYLLKRGNGLSDIELTCMTAEERRWWVKRIKKENEDIENSGKLNHRQM
tara:strand:+ start:14760 stop:14915 length:156 start_codon:yes stop_codon:yes gene_type:complete